jgi:hypothetical protein
MSIVIHVPLILDSINVINVRRDMNQVKIDAYAKLLFMKINVFNNVQMIINQIKLIYVLKQVRFLCIFREIRIKSGI